MTHSSSILMFLLFSACGPSAETVQAAIDEANYCDTEEDCDDLGAICPFDCYILVNESEADEVQSLIDDFLKGETSHCNYGCPSLGNIVCEDGTCAMSEALEE